LATETDVQRRHEEVLAAEADVQRRHEEVLAAAAAVQRRHKEVLAAEANVQRRQEAVLAAEAADVQRRHKSAARAAESDAVIERIWTEFALSAAPLDAILAEIACKEAAFKTKLTPPSYIICGRSPFEYGRGHTTVFAPRWLAGSTIARRRQPTPDGSSPCPTLPSHWSAQHPSSAQFVRRGGSNPP
jgi:hypothetical protein